MVHGVRNGEDRTDRDRRVDDDPDPTAPEARAAAAGARDTTPPSFTARAVAGTRSLPRRRPRRGADPEGQRADVRALRAGDREGAGVRIAARAPSPRKLRGAEQIEQAQAVVPPDRHPSATSASKEYPALTASAFSGRVGGHALKPGPYRLTLIAIDAARQRLGAREALLHDRAVAISSARAPSCSVLATWRSPSPARRSSREGLVARQDHQELKRAALAGTRGQPPASAGFGPGARSRRGGQRAGARRGRAAGSIAATP